MSTISQAQQKAVRSYFERVPHVVAVYLYGSWSRGTHNALSDIDVAVMVEPGAVNPRDFHLDVIGTMMDIFQTDNVDVQLLDYGTPPFLARSMIGGRVLYCRSARKKVRVEAAILSRCQDFYPFQAKCLTQVAMRMEEGTYAA